MNEIRISAKERDPKTVSGHALRKGGLVPGVYYTRTGENRCLQFDRNELQNLLRQEIGILNVEVNGENLACIIREVQRHPVRRDVLHIDLMGVIKGQKIRAHVPVHLIGTAQGLKEGGTLDVVLRDIEVECLPVHLPTHVDVDVSHLALNEAVRVSDIQLPEVTILSDLQGTIAHVVPPRAVTEETEAAATEAAPAEPEVIRERKSEEGEEKK
ncbi:MAG: 50S ribosomal protein L25 [bacterium]|nr:50S ribosomal protein L25 [bacterium]